MYNSAMVLGCSVSEFCRPATGQKKMVSWCSWIC